jgi:hypothetical protein
MQNTNSKDKFLMTTNEGRRVNLKPGHEACPKRIYTNVEFHVLKTVTMKNTIFQDKTPCSLAQVY